MIDIANLFDFLLFAFFWIWLNFLFIFIMHYLMPSNILEAYFKEPYFKTSEIAAFSGFPLGYIRTIMFMRILGFPSSGQKRNIQDAYRIAPPWICKLSKIILISFVISFSLFLIVIGIMGLHMVLYA